MFAELLLVALLLLLLVELLWLLELELFALLCVDGIGDADLVGEEEPEEASLSLFGDCLLSIAPRTRVLITSYMYHQEEC